MVILIGTICVGVIVGTVLVTNPSLITNHFYHWFFNITYREDE